MSRLFPPSAPAGGGRGRRGRRAGLGRAPRSLEGSALGSGGAAGKPGGFGRWPRREKGAGGRVWTCLPGPVVLQDPPQPASRRGSCSRWGPRSPGSPGGCDPGCSVPLAPAPEVSAPPELDRDSGIVHFPPVPRGRLPRGPHCPTVTAAQTESFLWTALWSPPVCALPEAPFPLCSLASILQPTLGSWAPRERERKESRVSPTLTLTVVECTPMGWCRHLSSWGGQRRPPPLQSNQGSCISIQLPGRLSPIVEAAFEGPGVTRPVPSVLVYLPEKQTLCSLWTPWAWPGPPRAGESLPQLWVSKLF